MKRVLILAALLLGLVVGAGPVAAAPPSHPNPKAPVLNEGVFPVDGFCSFTVVFDLTGKIKVIDLPGDRTTTISPGAKVTLTANGKTAKFVITGTVHEQLMKDAKGVTFIDVQAKGKNILFLPAPKPGLVFTTGNFHYTLNADRTERTRFNADGPGQVVDVCALLS